MTMNVVTTPETKISNFEHKHHCEACGTYWKHSNNFQGNEEAHKCPNCGKEQWKKFFNDDEAAKIKELEAFFSLLEGRGTQRQHDLLKEVSNQFYNEL